MGLQNQEEDSFEKFMVEEAKASPNLIGNSTFNITRPGKLKECLPACRTQKNELIYSEAQFPPKRDFLPQKQACIFASHLFQVTCASEERKFFLEEHYPNLCKVLEKHSVLFNNESSCKNWPDNMLSMGPPDSVLEMELSSYAQENLINAKYFIQSPFITVIKRDVQMSLTNFVSNTGGLLGLYFGFSIISLFELIFWCYKCVFAKNEKMNNASRINVLSYP